MPLLRDLVFKASRGCDKVIEFVSESEYASVSECVRACACVSEYVCICTGNANQQNKPPTTNKPRERRRKKKRRTKCDGGRYTARECDAGSVPDACGDRDDAEAAVVHRLGGEDLYGSKENIDTIECGEREKRGLR